jgi:hypothetical protein
VLLSAGLSWRLFKRQISKSGRRIRVHILQGAKFGGITCPLTLSIEEIESLRASVPDADISTGPDTPSETEILVGAAPGMADFDRASPNLRAVIVPFAGLPPALATLVRERERSGANQVAVHSLHHNHILAAEMAVALLLSASKLIVPADRLLRRYLP